MSKKFNKIVCIDKTNLEPWALQQLQQYSTSGVEAYSDYPKDENEIIKRIGDAECIFVSWNTKITANIIRQANNLQYIGMCCSLIDKTSSNVDVIEAESHNIDVRGVKDYGDEGVVEYIFSELIALAKGLKNVQWKAFPTELKGKNLGVIGFGTLGTMVANVATAFGMNVFYFSRTRKEELESEAIKYLPLPDLLSKSDVITTHLPRNNRILGENEFGRMKGNTILINTSLGPTYDIEAFKQWVSQNDNFAIVDEDGAEGYQQIYESYTNVLYSPIVAGMTDGAYFRLSQKVIQNVIEHLKD
jgi:hypothetical protein